MSMCVVDSRHDEGVVKVVDGKVLFLGQGLDLLVGSNCLKMPGWGNNEGFGPWAFVIYRVQSAVYERSTMLFHLDMRIL